MCVDVTARISAGAVSRAADGRRSGSYRVWYWQVRYSCQTRSDNLLIYVFFSVFCHCCNDCQMLWPVLSDVCLYQCTELCSRLEGANNGEWSYTFKIAKRSFRICAVINYYFTNSSFYWVLTMTKQEFSHWWCKGKMCLSNRDAVIVRCVKVCLCNTGAVIGLVYSGPDSCQVCQAMLVTVSCGSTGLVAVSSSNTVAARQVDTFFVNDVPRLAPSSSIRLRR